MVSIYRGDSTSSFGGTFLTVYLENPHDYVISRAELRIGVLPIITFYPEEGETSVTFPLKVNLTSSQTRQLKEQNDIYLAVYDVEDNKATCKGTISFKTMKEVV